MPSDIVTKRTSNIVKKLLICVFTAFFIITAAACGPAYDEGVSRTGFYFDTVIQITVYDRALIKDGTADKVLDRCMELAGHYEELLSVSVEGSDIYDINHSSGNAVAVDPETYELVSLALMYADMSGGMFNPAIGALTDLWDFTGGSDDIPDEAAITNALDHIDLSCVELTASPADDPGAPASSDTQGSGALRNDDTVYMIRLTDPGMRIDLGGIAKGYIADRMKALLEEEGVTSAIINLGGNILTTGNKPDGSAFRVGIRKPFGAGNETSAIAEVSGRSVVTSGTYERYFEKGGRLYHHILDPRTGYPADTGLYSVTIISDSSTDGDALSTICLLMGREKGMELIESHPGIEALFITSDQEIYTSSGW